MINKGHDLAAAVLLFTEGLFIEAVFFKEDFTDFSQ